MDGKPLNSAIALKKAGTLHSLKKEERFILAMAYVAFRAKCVSIAREVSTSAVVETGQTTGRTGVKT